MRHTIREIIDSALFSDNQEMRHLATVLDDMAYTMSMLHEEGLDLYSAEDHVSYIDELTKWVGIVDARKEKIEELEVENNALKFQCNEGNKHLIDKALSAEVVRLKTELERAYNTVDSLSYDFRRAQSERDDAISKMRTWNALTKDYSQR